MDKQTRPLEIAGTVLHPDTIRSVRNRGFSNSAYLILDRWALNTPDALQRLEQSGTFALMRRLSEQYEAEAETLNSDSAWIASRQGMSDFEILLDAGIDMGLRA